MYSSKPMRNKLTTAPLIRLSALPRIFGVILISLAAIVTTVASPPSSAFVNATPTPTLNWIRWTNPGFPRTDGSLPQPGYLPYTFNYATEALGEITMPDQQSMVFVKLNGEIASGGGTPSAFGTTEDSYWRSLTNTQGSGAYISTNVPTLPTNSDRIGVIGSSVPTQSLTFYSDRAHTLPVNVSNIVMNIYSLGAPGTPGAWDFNQVFSILSDNRPRNSAFGFTKSTPTPGTHRLSASEGSGTIQFNGTFNTISWTVTQPEAFATWNIGVTPIDPPLDVIFDTQGGSSINAQQTTIGGSLSDPGTPSRDGYTFAGWFTAATGGTALSFPHAHGQNTGFILFAQWTAVPITVDNAPSPAPELPPNSITAPVGSSPISMTPSAESATTNRTTLSTLPSTGSSTQIPSIIGFTLLIFGMVLTTPRQFVQLFGVITLRKKSLPNESSKQPLDPPFIET